MTTAWEILQPKKSRFAPVLFRWIKPIPSLAAIYNKGGVKGRLMDLIFF
jgi:hypothetical protein